VLDDQAFTTETQRAQRGHRELSRTHASAIRYRTYTL
jgi:hypothetical protein